MFNNKNARQRLKDHFVLRINEASNNTIQADVVDRMAETLVLVSTDTMALTHTYLIADAAPLNDVNLDQIKTSIIDDFTRNIEDIASRVNTDAVSELARGAEKTAKSVLGTVKGLAKNAAESFHAARVNTDEELLNNAVKLFEEKHVTCTDEEIQNMFETEFKLPAKWAVVLFYRTRATIASRRK